MPATHVDFLIVGQGLAGSLFSHFLEKEGKDYIIIDQPDDTIASAVAAGIMNPFTGRKFVKSWMMDDLFPFAISTYRELEIKFNDRFFFPLNIIRTFSDNAQENEWLIRSDNPSYQKYIVEPPTLSQLENKVKTSPAFAEFSHGGRMDIPKLVASFRKYFTVKNAIFEDVFDYSLLQYEKNNIRYKNITSKNIIFCEGWKARHNPFFNHLPHEGAKGELLIVKIPGANFDKIIKTKHFIVPLGEDLYWVGATHQRSAFDGSRSPERKKLLEDWLSQTLNIPFEIVAHKTGIRPTSKDRRPLLGEHPEYEGFYIFNGLGGKGASLGPYWAKKLVDAIINNTTLQREASIERYE